MDSISLALPHPRLTHEGGDQARKTMGVSDRGGAFPSHLDLSLGISSDYSAAFTSSCSCRPGSAGGQAVDHRRQLPGSSSFASAINEEDHHLAGKSWLDQAAEAANAALHSGFIHPWSLAARQQKAVYEQAIQKHRSYNNNFSASPSSPMTRAGSVANLSSLSPAALVGWPPLRASRKSLGGCSDLIKAAADDESMNRINGSEAQKKPKLMEKEDVGEMDVDDYELRTAMFVKVNMEGFAVGRKINLKAHDGYCSLSRALCKLFHSFLSNNYLNSSADCSSSAIIDDDFILLYEDNEGDQMLVGDIPWKLFVASVKKLYIAHNPKKVAPGRGKILHEESTGDQ